MADAAESGDHVLITIFSHGDYDSAGGLCIGVDLFTNDDCEKSLKPSHGIYPLGIPRHQDHYVYDIVFLRSLGGDHGI